MPIGCGAGAAAGPRQLDRETNEQEDWACYAGATGPLNTSLTPQRVCVCVCVSGRAGKGNWTEVCPRGHGMRMGMGMEWKYGLALALWLWLALGAVLNKEVLLNRPGERRNWDVCQSVCVRRWMTALGRGLSCSVIVSGAGLCSTLCPLGTSAFVAAVRAGPCQDGRPAS